MKIAEGFELISQGGSYLVVDSQGGRQREVLFALNETGVFLWKQLEKGAEKDQLVEQLEQEYGARPEDIPLMKADIEEFLEQLSSLGTLAD